MTGGISAGDIVVILLLILWVALAVYVMIKRRKKGKCIGCGGNCSCCRLAKNKGDKSQG